MWASGENWVAGEREVSRVKKLLQEYRWETVAWTEQVAQKRGKWSNGGHILDTELIGLTIYTQDMWTWSLVAKYPQEYLLSVLAFLLLTCPHIKTEDKIWTISWPQAQYLRHGGKPWMMGPSDLWQWPLRKACRHSQLMWATCNSYKKYQGLEAGGQSSIGVWELMESKWLQIRKPVTCLLERTTGRDREINQ